MQKRDPVVTMRVGLFGGTFNPIHLGHLRAALEVKGVFALDDCHLIPAAIPPHKNADAVAAAEDRLEMIRLAVSDSTGLSVCDVELMRSGLSFSIDTIRYFESILPEQAEAYFILGQDAFLEIDTWKSYRDIFGLIKIIVMLRPTPKNNFAGQLKNTLLKMLNTTVDPGYRYSEASSGYIHPRLQPVFIQPVTLLDISSSKIRQMIQAGRSVEYLLPQKVIDYIETRGLYR